MPGSGVVLHLRLTWFALFCLSSSASEDPNGPPQRLGALPCGSLGDAPSSVASRVPADGLKDRSIRTSESTFCAWTRLGRTYTHHPVSPDEMASSSSASFLPPAAASLAPRCVPSGLAKIGSTRVHTCTNSPSSDENPPKVSPRMRIGNQNRNLFCIQLNSTPQSLPSPQLWL